MPTAPQGRRKVYRDKAAIAAAELSADILWIIVRNYPAIPAGMETELSSVESEPQHDGKVQSADGRWWEITSEAVTPQMFGYTGEDSGTDTAAFKAASTYIEVRNGGRLLIPPGLYVYGKQEFAAARGVGYAYRSPNLIQIHKCSEPVMIELRGTIFRTAPGLKYGSFDPITGLASAPTMPFFDSDYIADLGSIIDIEGNVSVTITGPAEFDGNVGNLIVGGQWGDQGRQLRHVGIHALNNKSLYCENLQVHHMALDGFVIGWYDLKEQHPPFPHTLKNCRALYNGRQGLSWIGGNSLLIEGGEFSHTGKNDKVSSPPGAGIDVEAEASFCTGLIARGVRFFDNTGCGFLADSGPSYRNILINCILIGTTNTPLWITKAQYKLVDCIVVGAVLHLYGDIDPTKATQVERGLWSMDPTDSPTGKIYDSVKKFMDFNDAVNVRFEGSRFTAGSLNILPYSVERTIYSNITAVQTGPATAYMRGTFLGHSTIQTGGAIAFESSEVRGTLVYNKRRIADGRPD